MLLIYVLVLVEVKNSLNGICSNCSWSKIFVEMVVSNRRSSNNNSSCNGIAVVLSSSRWSVSYNYSISKVLVGSKSIGSSHHNSASGCSNNTSCKVLLKIEKKS